jgi:hypothetical protein
MLRWIRNRAKCSARPPPATPARCLWSSWSNGRRRGRSTSFWTRLRLLGCCDQPTVVRVSLLNRANKSLAAVRLNALALPVEILRHHCCQTPSCESDGVSRIFAHLLSHRSTRCWVHLPLECYTSCQCSALPISKISMNFLVAPNTKSHQIFIRVIAQSASGLNVMDLKTFNPPTQLATPAISLQDFAAELAIGFRIKPQAWPFSTNSSQSVTWTFSISSCL